MLTTCGDLCGIRGDGAVSLICVDGVPSQTVVCGSRFGDLPFSVSDACAKVHGQQVMLPPKYGTKVMFVPKYYLANFLVSNMVPILRHC